MARIEAGGDVDELTSLLGLLMTALTQEAPEVEAELRRIQCDLFRLGARVATTPGSPQAELLADVEETSICALEEAMDRMQMSLPPLKAFILPGGHPSAAWAHLARTVCRRAERRVVSLVFDSERADTDQHLGNSLKFLNRLSDYLFLLARHLNQQAGVDDFPWRR